MDSYVLARTIPLVNSSGELPGAEQATGNWTFSEDVPSKPGWWIDSCRRRHHFSRVGFGSTANFWFGYLSSWSPNMGAVRISVVGDPTGWFAVINGSVSHKSRRGHISIPDYQSVCVSEQKGLSRRHELPSCGRPTLQCCATPVCGAMQRCNVGTSVLRHLRIELIPKSAAHNKFVIRYISTC